MTPEAQRIAIAEACGWEHCTKRNGIIVGYAPCEARKVQGVNGPTVSYTEPFRTEVPPYEDDLSAMHEAENIVDHQLYVAQLLAVIHDVGEDYFDRVSWENAYELARATAAQRAEAFLKTIGKWKEEL